MGRISRVRLSPVRLALALLAAALLTLAGRAYSGYRALERTRADVRTLQQLQSRDPATLSPADLASAASTLQSLATQLQTLDAASALPLGSERLIQHLPWVGPRYAADRRLVQLGIVLTESGRDAATIAQQTLSAFQATGMQANDAAGPTWLDVLAQHRGDADRIAGSLTTARQLRAGIDPALLPASLCAELPRLDQALSRVDPQAAAGQDLPALLKGLGADHPVRYLILFQNPAELRPSGGFPGTMGLVTIDRGRLVSYEIFDAHQLTDDYIAQRKEKLPEPWPIEQFFPQDGFLLHDAGWYADFPRAAATMMAMYAETNWPPINGVIAIQPTVVGDLLKATGPVDVEIDGEQRHVTADNVYDEIERQRRLIVEGIKPWDQTRQVHKEAVAIIGEAILEKLKTADRGQLKQAAGLLMQAANVRDIQLAHADPVVEHVIDLHGWSGRLQFDTAPQAVAVTFANVALGKSSQYMQPTLAFAAGLVENGRRLVTLTITVANDGPLGEDPLYSGYQHWWIAIELPQGFVGQSSSLPLQPDPDSPSGGSFAVEVWPQQSQQLSITFTMPADAQFILRRQPGLTTANVELSSSGCDGSSVATLDHDLLVDLGALCGG